MASVRNKVFKVPYDKTGNLRNRYVKGDEWRDNRPFRATIKFDHLFHRKNGSPLLIWRDPNGYTYPMFVSSLPSLLDSGGPVLDSGEVTAVWRVVKSGDRYGLVFHSDAKDFQVDKETDLW